MSVISLLDRRFYPTFDDYWDTTMFRAWIDRQLTGASRLLDFGAGRGALTALDLRAPGRRVSAVDVDSAVLENPNVDDRDLLGAGGVIPHPDATFDVVVAHNVMEHLPDPVQTFTEIHRVLRAGGMFLGKTPNRRHYVPLGARLTPQWFHVWYNRQRGREDRDTFPTHYRCNTPGAIRAVARATGLVVDDIELVEGRPEYLRVTPALYALGIAYERLVNRVVALRSLRGVLFTRLRKPLA